MSRSNNSRKGSQKGNSLNEFWSRRAEGKYTSWSGSFAKKKTARVERQLNKPKKDDFES